MRTCGKLRKCAVISFLALASSASYAQPEVIEAATWAEAFERVRCPLRLVDEADGTYSIRGPFVINGQGFVNSTPVAREIVEKLKRGCGTGGGGESGGAGGSGVTSANGDYGSASSAGVKGSVFQDLVGGNSGSSGSSGSNADLSSPLTKTFQTQALPAAVPGPVVGAGLPGLLAGFGAVLVWYRRRRATI